MMQLSGCATLSTAMCVSRLGNGDQADAAQHLGQPSHKLTLDQGASRGESELYTFYTECCKCNTTEGGAVQTLWS